MTAHDFPEDKEVTNFESFSRSGGEKYELRVGTEIKFLDNMPPYKVTAITSDAPPKLTMVCQGNTTYHYTVTDEVTKEEVAKTCELPQTIELTMDKTCMVGRAPTCHAVIDASSISRSHVSLHYDKSRKKVVLTATNHNNGYIKNAVQFGTERVQDVVGAAETVSDFRVEHAMTEVPLRKGMLVQILPDTQGYVQIPPYVVKKAVGGARPELVMEIEGDTHGFPRTIKLDGKSDTKSLGRGGATYEFNHPAMHRGQAFLGWDDSEKTWTYTTTFAPPSINVGMQLLQDMREACEDIKPGNVANARKQVDEIDALIADMQDVRCHMANVQKLEAATVVTPYWERHRGAMTEDSQRGYRNWLQAYKILYKEKITPETGTALDLAMSGMKAMADLREELRDIESFATTPTGLPSDMRGILKACSKANYNKEMQAIVDAECAPLNEKPPRPSFIVSGFRGHHTVTRIDKDDKGYVVRTYNAGAGAKELPDGSVMGMYQQRLNKGVDVAGFIRLVNERKIRPYFNVDGAKIEQAMENALGPVETFRAEPAQQKGNCTTRSTREMLKDILKPEVFTHVHQHVSNPEVCDPAEVMAALQIRRNALNVFIEKQGAQSVIMPKNQIDWEKSVESIIPESSRAGWASRSMAKGSGASVIAT